MFTFGIHTRAQYLGLGEKRRCSGARVAYNLLRVGEPPTADEIQAFEDICFTLFTSNGTSRTTFRNRFKDVDQAVMQWLKRSFDTAAPLYVQDRAVSNGLTSFEWAQSLYPVFPAAELEASDLLLEFVELSLDDGSIYIAEPDGTPLQYIKRPFVVGVHHPESRRYPLHRWVAARARKRFARLNLPAKWTEGTGGAGYRVTRFSCIHPQAQALLKSNPHFQFRKRSVFECTPDSCHVIRTMNILNPAYFSQEQLIEGVRAVFGSLKEGGIWILGRTLEEDFTNHVSFLCRRAGGWEVLERIGKGSQIEELAMSHAR